VVIGPWDVPEADADIRDIGHAIGPQRTLDAMILGQRVSSDRPIDRIAVILVKNQGRWFTFDDLAAMVSVSNAERSYKVGICHGAASRLIELGARVVVDGDRRISVSIQ
jgi:hypothetical protein